MGIGGLEFLAQIPGTIGGTIRMNGGVKGWEIGKRVIAVRGVDGWIDGERLRFEYRNSNIDFPIFEALLRIEGKFDPELDRQLKELRKNQPKGPSLGSVFKNPPGDYAGRLIEKAGLKGVRIGGMEVSPRHANFFINRGGGTFEDMVQLIRLVRERVLERFGVKLELEIKVVDSSLPPSLFEE
jgi:UDP-N-acetylmuramate dehydrogenase